MRVLRESNAFAISRSFGLLPGNRSLHPILSPRVSLLSAFLFPLRSLSNFLLPFSLPPYLPPPHLAPSAAVMSSSSSLLFISEVSGLWSCSSNNNNNNKKTSKCLWPETKRCTRRRIIEHFRIQLFTQLELEPGKCIRCRRWAGASHDKVNTSRCYRQRASF